MNVLKKQKGFTIIEVVLVLAIAGLIFLVVFLALPALQRNQRDTQRRSDIGRAVAAVQSWMSNKNGAIPTPADFGTSTTSIFITDYLTVGGSSFIDPSGGGYRFAHTIAPGTAPNADVTASNDVDGGLAYKIGASCNGTAKTNAVSIVAKLEGGGFYCANN